MMVLAGVGLVIIGVIIFSILVYNSFITLNNRVSNAWAQINVQLKKRSDLIPKLVQVVKGYSKYEKTTLTEITKLRTAIDNSKSVSKKYELNQEINKLITRFFIVAENYPELKANENFKLLQEEITDVEDKIAYARQFYNDVVFKFNTRLQSFPFSLIGNIMGLKTAEPFSEKSDYKGVSF
ncbi:MAG: LemA family protein [Nanoarchaeota archaeon]|nr:LemA family protein [Nanoarchaeota archaeon]